MISHFFTDLDGLLAHSYKPEDEQGIEVGNGFYIAESNLERLSALRSLGLKIGLVTTRRYSTAQAALNSISHDYSIVDHGAIVQTGTEIDKEWLESLRPYIGNPLTREKKGVLWDYEEQLKTDLSLKGYQIHSDDRFGSFRVIPPSPATAQELENLVQRKIPDGIDAVIIRGRFVDFFASAAGKANSIRRVLEKSGISNASSVAYAGDDKSDIQALQQFYPITLASAISEVKNVVAARRGYISPQTGHLATADIISHVEAMSRSDTRR